MPWLQEAVNDAQIPTTLQEAVDKFGCAIISRSASGCKWISQTFCCFSFIPFSSVDLASVSRGRGGGERRQLITPGVTEQWLLVLLAVKHPSLNVLPRMTFLAEQCHYGCVSLDKGKSTRLLERRACMTY